MRRWRGGTGCSRHRDTDRPTPRSPSLTFSSLFLTLHLCSPCLSLHLLPHLPVCLLPPPPPPPAVDGIVCHLHVTHTCSQHPRLLFQRSRLTGGCSAWCHACTRIRQLTNKCVCVAKEYQCVKGDPVATCMLTTSCFRSESKKIYSTREKNEHRLKLNE